MWVHMGTMVLDPRSVQISSKPFLSSPQPSNSSAEELQLQSVQVLDLPGPVRSEESRV